MTRTHKRELLDEEDDAKGHGTAAKDEEEDGDDEDDEGTDKAVSGRRRATQVVTDEVKKAKTSQSTDVDGITMFDPDVFMAQVLRQIDQTAERVILKALGDQSGDLDGIKKSIRNLTTAFNDNAKLLDTLVDDTETIKKSLSTNTDLKKSVGAEAKPAQADRQDTTPRAEAKPMEKALADADTAPQDKAVLVSRGRNLLSKALALGNDGFVVPGISTAIAAAINSGNVDAEMIDGLSQRVEATRQKALADAA